MGINTLIEELHNNLINDINSSKLPVGVVYFVLKDIFNETERGYINALNSEKILPEKTEKEVVENEEK